MPGTITSQSDLETLLELNRDYIYAVQASDVRRFDEILADDFLCTNPDGSLVDRTGFLQQTARPVGLSHLQAHDVKVRLMGDVAIIHACTPTQDQRTSNTSLPRRWRDSLTRCASAASVSL
jgi:ketosteroid isomerase-like protein